MAPCAVCDHPAGPDPFFYLWRDREWEVYRCRRCSHQFVWPSLSCDEQAAVFSDSYFTRDGDWACGWWGASYDDAEHELRAEARDVLDCLPEPCGRLLDIGCAGGVFLDEARAAGWRVSGIEFNDSMAERARGRRLNVVTAAIETTPLQLFGDPFDAVVMMDTLEHIPRPRAVLERVSQWTRPGSTLLIRGPLNNDRRAVIKESLRRLVRVRKQLPGYPLDANMFNRRSLSLLVSSFGFHVRRWPGQAPGFANMVATRGDLNHGW